MSKRVVGICYVGWQVTNRSYILLRYADDLSRPGVFVYLGPPISISLEQMEKQGVTIVLGHLRNTAACDSKNLGPTDKKSLLRIKSKYALVSIELNMLEANTEELTVIPLHARRGWQFDSHAEEVRSHSIPRTNQDFLKILNGALEIAT